MNQSLEKRVNLLEDFQAISNLQGRYNHYLATNQYGKIGGLFAQDHDIKAEIADSGVWEGKEEVAKLFQHLGTKYNMPGALFVHMLLTPVIEVAEDGQSAKGMWNSFGTNTYKAEDNQLDAMWQLGKYDQTFVKENGQWKYKEFRWHVIFRTPYHEGWVKKPIVEGLHEEGFPPVGEFYKPYDPNKHNEFLPVPPEPRTVDKKV
ncbi:hypothetical protein COM86_28615 [Priestia megaterium]|uniref:nuclear transport factor 2 family protein n=1 Tax=Priestia megaterium TaxID=1404 RepID=UPI000BEC64B3|nr:nuclear transport factor 2 family protein [Priestia megaterium]PEB60660.1 hypothetical protein COM86_28615 [Priestia megaterium]